MYVETTILTDFPDCPEVYKKIIDDIIHLTARESAAKKGRGIFHKSVWLAYYRSGTERQLTTPPEVFLSDPPDFAKGKGGLVHEWLEREALFKTLLPLIPCGLFAPRTADPFKLELFKGFIGMEASCFMSTPQGMSLFPDEDLIRFYDEILMLALCGATNYLSLTRNDSGHYQVVNNRAFMGSHNPIDQVSLGLATAFPIGRTVGDVLLLIERSTTNPSGVIRT